MRVDSCTNYSNGGNGLRNRRPFPLSSSKFWLRLIRPWKWRHLRRKVQRSGSERSRKLTPSRLACCPPSPSLPNFHDAAQSVVLPEEFRVNVVNGTSKISGVSAEDNAPSTSVCTLPPDVYSNGVTKVRIDDMPPTCLFPAKVNNDSCAVQGESLDTKAGGEDVSYSDVGETSIVEEISYSTDSGETSFLEGYVGVEAKEPNLDARPEKPVLKKPGQPSRLNVRKKQTNKRNEVGFVRDELPTRLTDDSDSDNPIEYRNSNTCLQVPGTTSRSSDDEDDVPIGGLASKVLRRDTLALRLDAPPCKDDISGQTADDRRALMHKASMKLERKLSERPTVEELENRNILRNPAVKTMEEKRKLLLRKLSFRPTIAQLKEQQIIQFNDYVEVTQAEAYDRKADKPWTRLTSTDKALIRKELNDFKATEMDVHEESRMYTRFHRP
ncbi:hypothetical protein KIN20_025626 [Parelaphostrongylus tenuis]|uniref:Phosphatase and actin regulator n=1 Tax=Parelaphostrongylus tenuis TaxID=148309 RepID=A0AAD5NDF5_PARTN|nr:hypothetical protein KIN20_025626 [Parelaphostrongylus tenuis]